MASQEDINEQIQRLAAHRATLTHYLHQRAQLSTAREPPEVATGIAEARAGIAHCKATLRRWGVAVEDHPDDTARGDTPQARRSLWPLRLLFVTAALLLVLIIIYGVSQLRSSIAIQGNGNVTNTGPGAIIINQGVAPDLHQQTPDHPILQTDAGRTVRADVRSWMVVRTEDFTNSPPDLYFGSKADDYATSMFEVKDGHYSLTMDSKRNATDMAGFDTHTTALKNFYVTATVTKLPGPSDSQCGIIFGYQDQNHWSFFRLRDDGTFSISQDRGSLPHSLLAGPYPSAAINKNGPNTMFIVAQNGSYRFFVNDVEVYKFSDKTIPVPTGTFDLGIQTPNSPGVVTCIFDNFEVRTPRT